MKFAVECQLFGALKRSGKKNKLTVKLSENTDYRTLLIKHLKFSEKHLRYFTVVADENIIGDYSEVIPSDTKKITVMMAISGG